MLKVRAVLRIDRKALPVRFGRFAGDAKVC